MTKSITITGGPKTGKTTWAKTLFEEYKRKGKHVRMTDGGILERSPVSDSHPGRRGPPDVSILIVTISGPMKTQVSTL